MLRKFYMLAGGALLATYALIAWTGMEFGSEEAEVIGPDARQAGSYRSTVSRYSGYRGGK